MNAFIDYNKNFKNISETLFHLKKMNIKSNIVSMDDSNKNNNDFLYGDIIAIMNAQREKKSIFISSPIENVFTINQISQIQCFSLSDKKSSDFISSFENLEQRAKVSKLFDSKKIFDCSIVCGDEYFWEKVFRIHARWLKSRFVTKKEFYHDLLINFCISLYDYKVSLIKGD